MFVLVVCTFPINGSFLPVQTSALVCIYTGLRNICARAHVCLRASTVQRIKGKAMQIKRLKLYHSPALRSTRVKWLLHEILGDDFDVESIDAYSDLYTPEFRKLNPNHALPVLEITLENNETVVMIE